MQKKSLYFLLGVVTLLAFGCRRENGINNDQVIKTPYALFFSDTSGALFKTNDGTNVTNLFPPDGKNCRALCVSGPNVIMVKNRTYYSTNGGFNFNLSLGDTTRPDDTTYTSNLCMRYYGRFNQSMILDVPEYNTVYLSHDPLFCPPKGVGVAFNLNKNGEYRYWQLCLGDTTLVGPHVGNLPVGLNSLTRMKNGVIVGYDYKFNRVFYAWSKQYGANFPGWIENTGNNPGIPGHGDPYNQTGDPLPVAIDSFTIGHLNNRLIAAPVGCSGGVYYSDDTGRNWKAYGTGIGNAPALCVASPFEEICLIGTHGKGLYILNAHTGVWQQNNNGLPGNLVVRNIAAKTRTFKNGNVEQYIYLATNQGIYQSKDKGFNWVLTIPGNYTCVY